MASNPRTFGARWYDALNRELLHSLWLARFNPGVSHYLLALYYTLNFCFNSHSLYTSTLLTNISLLRLCKNPTTRTVAAPLLNSLCSRQVLLFVAFFNMPRFLPSFLDSWTKLTTRNRKNSLASTVQKCFPHPCGCLRKIVRPCRTCAHRLQSGSVRFSESIHFGTRGMVSWCSPTRRYNISMGLMERPASLFWGLIDSPSHQKRSNATRWFDNKRMQHIRQSYLNQMLVESRYTLLAATQKKSDSILLMKHWIATFIPHVGTRWMSQRRFFALHNNL